MPDKRLPPDSPPEWLNRASSDIAIAKIKIPGVYLEDLCYHAQQSSEKSLKAVLLHKVGFFPYTHDLSILLGLIEKNGISLPETVKSCAGLTGFAVESRYPGLNEPLTELEWQDAVSKAEVFCYGQSH